MDSFALFASGRQLREQLRNKYVSSNHEWVDVILSTNGAATITIVSEQFAEMSNRQREDEVRQFCAEITGDLLDIVWLTLVIPQAAEDMMLTPPEEEPNFVGSWLDFAYAILNQQRQLGKKETLGKSRVVVFYSYKGGVGRTTAMLHVAYLLAKAGRRIALVDMDLEAPGLRHAVETLEPEPQQGLVDYLYERQLLSPDIEPAIQIIDIVGQVKSKLETKADIYIIPAGKVDLDYISKVDDLDTRLGSSGLHTWHTFLQELANFLEPDLIFIDSRTGFNRWGAISLLLLADEAFIFAYPNRQNLEGLVPLLTALQKFGHPHRTFVLSMIPDNPDGQQLIDNAWAEVAHLLNLPDDVRQHPPVQRGRPIVVPYNTAVATASHFPVANAEAYRELAARLDDIVDEADHIQALNLHDSGGLDEDERWRLVESIKIPEPFAEREFNQHLFQPIKVLEDVLVPHNILIRGRKGTGKSYLFRAFQSKTLRSLRPDKLIGVWAIPAHGLGAVSVDSTAFKEIAAQIKKQPSLTWEGFWSSHALVQLWVDDIAQTFTPVNIMSSQVFAPYKAILAELSPSFKKNTAWTSIHTKVTLRLAGSDLGQSYASMLQQMKEEKSRRRKTGSIWLLYDNLEFDLPYRTPYWAQALEGLFRFSYTLDEYEIDWLRPKVFLREDLWQRLKFVNKSHFTNRQVELNWQKIDLLRLAYRLITQSGRVAEFLQEYYSGITEPNQADENMLANALGLVWGVRRAPGGNALPVDEWLYQRMTDAANTTYPREMMHLLKAARSAELETRGNYPIPNDRLLREESLNHGLRYASKKRCEALQSDEYEALEPFFAGVRGLPSEGNSSNLERIWEETMSDLEPHFMAFMELLQDIGVISLERRIQDEVNYTFADIYVDGLGLTRHIKPA